MSCSLHQQVTTNFLLDVVSEPNSQTCASFISLSVLLTAYCLQMLYFHPVQRSIYAARNDDVHLRLRVKLTIVDRHKSRARESDGRPRIKRSKASDPPNSDYSASSSVSLSMKQRVEGELVADPSELSVLTDNDVAMQPSAGASGSDTGISVDKPMDSTISLSGQGSEPGAGQAAPLNGHSGPHSPTSVHSRTTVTRQYQLCQYGHPEPGRNIVVRSAILVKIHGDAFSFLSLLGYRYDALVLHSREVTAFCAFRDSQVYIFLLLLLDSFEDEYVRRGYSFLYGNLCRISIFKKYKVRMISFGNFHSCITAVTLYTS